MTPSRLPSLTMWRWVGVVVLAALATAPCVPVNPVLAVMHADGTHTGGVVVRGDITAPCHLNLSGSVTLESGGSLVVADGALLTLQANASHHAHPAVVAAFDGGMASGGVVGMPMVVPAADLIRGYYWSNVAFGPNAITLPGPADIETALTDAGVTPRVGMRLPVMVVSNHHDASAAVIVNSTVPGGIFKTLVNPAMTYTCKKNAICKLLYIVTVIKPLAFEIIGWTL